MLHRIVILFLLATGAVLCHSAYAQPGQSLDVTDRAPSRVQTFGLGAGFALPSEFGSQRLGRRDLRLVIGARYWVSNKVAINAEVSTTSLPAESVVRAPYRWRYHALGVGNAGRIALRGEWHFMERGIASSFVALGGSVAHSSSGRDIQLGCTIIGCPSQDEMFFRDHASSTELGADVDFGLEVRISSALSVVSSVGIGMNHSRATIMLPDSPDEQVSGSRTRFGIGIPRIFVSYYF